MDPQIIDTETGTESASLLSTLYTKDIENSESVSKFTSFYLSMLTLERYESHRYQLSIADLTFLPNLPNTMYCLAESTAGLLFKPVGYTTPAYSFLTNSPNFLFDSSGAVYSIPKYTSELLSERDANSGQWFWPNLPIVPPITLHSPVEQVLAGLQLNMTGIMDVSSNQIAEDVLVFSDKEGLSEYIDLLDGAINEIYRGVQFIELNLLEDPEAPEKRQVCFEIHIAGEPDKIIDDQKEFYRFLVRNIPSDKRDFFTFTYRVS